MLDVCVDVPTLFDAPGTSTSETEVLVDRLAAALRDAIPVTEQLDAATSTVKTSYRDVAQIVVELRHQFPGPNGESRDLRGRSSEYRLAVRAAYEGAGVDPHTRIARRITVGVAYWVRNILLDRYSREELIKLGVIDRSARQGWKMSDSATASPDDVMSIAVGMLNELAADSRYAPRGDAMIALTRAVLLLKQRLDTRA
jgi:hypothetical protein